MNVLVSDSGVEDINISKCFSANTKICTEFNSISSYIIWNFGNYSGNLTINEEMCGIIVTPNATVYQAAGNLNGQIISYVAGNNGELHQVTVTPNIPGIPDTPEDPKQPATPDEPEKPSETEESETPEEPKAPEEPKTPDTPTVVKTPEPPVTPNVPSTTTIQKTVEKPVAPKTGDNTSILINVLVVLVGLAMTIITILCFRNKK